MFISLVIASTFLFYEFIHIRSDGLDTTLHRGDGITLPLHSNPLSPNGTELIESHPGGTTAMGSSQVAAKYEYFVWSERQNQVFCDTIVIFHIFSYSVLLLDRIVVEGLQALEFSFERGDCLFCAFLAVDVMQLLRIFL